MKLFANDILNNLDEWLMKLVLMAGSVFSVWLLARMKRIRERLMKSTYMERNKRSLLKTSKAVALCQDLTDSSGAIYCHIIHYHNKGPQKMTVDVETIGHPCPVCITKCRNYPEIKRLQDHWQSRPITPLWLDICKKTLNMENQIQTVDYDHLDYIHKGIWEQANIYTFKECLIKPKRIGFICLSLSFCPRFKDFKNVDSMMHQAARELEKFY